jgi:hypothetical protein
MSIDQATSLARLDRQINDLGEWVYGTKSVPAYVKAELTEIKKTLRGIWEEIDPSAFGEGTHCGTVALLDLQGRKQGR